ncbi:sarcolemma associated protein a isoform X3 [Callorhinchus milii]|uniref:Sarcolemmal membrane-associated protein n=1 Tax=Callorhinchus milii TaxID=7868 RepID=V9K8L9_CALMI|nr:sarcolemma associated protein a isoform X3 [Callorhinchus milii]|eukprot:gi/632984109/ref/XP_007908977.1/ PREDICTED: sarcolemmal membrane-associated protein isoform X3 [Callorhinchus milii]
MPSALAIFTCRPNSHPFQERHVYLDEPVKIGRSVARCRPAQNNATFDCKVLSRNHALIWFDHKTGKFYLQDTKSSNGTFINSQRLSRGSEESPPCELLSGDIIQFGVDVTENTRKVTHGCIVSTVKLFIPDGMEARRRSDVIQAPLPLPVEKVAANSPSMYSQELFQLSQYLQEALHREQMLEQKLATLQRLLANTQEASDCSWQALIDEDRLLSRLEVMGNQLQAYSKNQTEDGIKKEMVSLQEDKHNYETTAKESLRRVLQEKIEVLRKVSEVERSLSNTEDECTHLKELNDRTQEELRELANKYNGAVNEIKELTDKLKHAEGRQEEIQLNATSEKKELQHRIDEMEEKEQALQARIEALQADNDFTNERLTALQVRIEQLQDKNLKAHNSIEHFLLKNGGDCTKHFQQFIECKSKLKSSVDSTQNNRISGLEGVLDSHLENDQTTEELQSNSERLKDQLIAEDHLTKVREETKLLKENQPETKESDMSDTLSPSKDRSGDDTTDCQMDEQELNESLNKVSLLKDELRRVRVETGESEHEIQVLHKELKEAQDLARTSKEKSFELQALLEEGRKINKQQAEQSARRIQFLQVQLSDMEKNIDILTKEKDAEIAVAHSLLASAQKEMVALQQMAVDTALDHENDIAKLHGELRSMHVELDRCRQTASECETVISNLQVKLLLQSQEQEAKQKEESIKLQGKLEELQNQYNDLQNEYGALKRENTTLTGKVQQFEQDLQSAQQQNAVLIKNVNGLETCRKELEVQVGTLKEQQVREKQEFRIQLAETENETRNLEKQYEANRTIFVEVKEKLNRTEHEKQAMMEELKECKENLKMLQEKGNNRRMLKWMPVMAVLVAVTVVVLYPGLNRASP